ncbi:unnamed protein product [Somion occarium]|uniref:BED-type domain-containing protein n=1 Tax=Somion occarium TaxID=3059160 RepID=A0ABP1DSJ5_9APHY
MTLGELVEDLSKRYHDHFPTESRRKSDTLVRCTTCRKRIPSRKMGKHILSKHPQQNENPAPSSQSQ